MEVINISETFREDVNLFIKNEWNGPAIVSLGNLYDSTDLPGFAAVEQGKLMGAALYRLDRDCCEISILFALEQNRKIGSLLIDAMRNEAKKLNCKRIWLVTTNDNTNAIRFYQKRGFSLKQVHINSFNKVMEIKYPHLKEPLIGIDQIPILHEFEFEMFL